MGWYASVTPLRAMICGRQEDAQKLGRGLLHEDLGLEVEPCRESQKLMAGPGTAVRAAVLTAAVGIETVLEGHIRTCRDGPELDDSYREAAR
jgi:hypothetical protein